MALELNGSSQYVDVANQILISATASWIFWVKVDSLNANNTIFAKRDGVSVNDWQIYCDPNSPYSAMSLLLWGLSTVGHETGDGFYEAGVWVHGVVTYDGSDVYVYKNGVQFDTYSATGNLVNDDISTHFGEDFYTGYLDGKISDFRIYNRALSLAEAKAIYDGTACGRHCSIWRPNSYNDFNHSPKRSIQ